MTDMQDICDQIKRGERRIRGTLYYALEDTKLSDGEIDQLLKEMRSKLSSEDREGMYSFHNNDPSIDIKLLETKEEYKNLLKDTPQEIKDILFLVCLIRQRKPMLPSTTQNTKTNNFLRGFTSRLSADFKNQFEKSTENQQNSFYYLLIITQANRLPGGGGGFNRTYTAPEDHTKITRYNRSILKNLLSNAKRIRIISSAFDMKDELNKLTIDSEDKAIDQNDSTNILVALRVKAKPSIMDQKTAMGILEKIDNTDLPLCYRINFLTSVKGMNDFMSLF